MEATDALDEFGVPLEVDVLSAHRMPQEMLAYGEEAAGRGPEGDHRRRRRSGPPARHARRVTPLPVIGVPGAARAPRRHRLAALDRADACRRPGGHRLDRRCPQRRAARRAGARVADPGLLERMEKFQHELGDKARAKGEALRRQPSAASASASDAGSPSQCRPTSLCCGGSTSAPGATASPWPTCARCSRISGYDDVRTHLQSGNAVFSTTTRSAAAVEKAVEAAIEKERPACGIRSAGAQCPGAAGEGPGGRPVRWPGDGPLPLHGGLPREAGHQEGDLTPGRRPRQLPAGGVRGRRQASLPLAPRTARTPASSPA